MSTFNRALCSPFIAVLITVLGSAGCGGDEEPEATPDSGMPMMDQGITQTGISCAPVCAFLMGQCGNITDACDRCARLNIDLRPAHEVRTRAACGTALGEMSCVGVSACLADKHGLTAYGPGAQVALNADGGDPTLPNVMVDDGWAIVGSKADATPSDLEVYFTVEGQMARLKVDDAAASTAAGERAVADYRVQFELDGMKTKFKAGVLQVVRIEPSGADPGFELTGQLRRDAGEMPVTLSLRGSFVAD